MRFFTSGVRLGFPAEEEGGVFRDVARRTEGLSGADLKVLCREAAMRPLRRYLSPYVEPPAPPATEEVGQRELDERRDDEQRLGLERLEGAAGRGEVSEEGIPDVDGEDFRVALRGMGGGDAGGKGSEECELWDAEFGSY